MSISGVLVHARQEKAEKVSEALNAMSGVEVHEKTADGRLIVTIEESDNRPSGEAVMSLSNIDGVLSASLIYQNFETDIDQ